ncbi:MAG: sodium-dependent transporter [Candidatus Nitrosotenuis sp.]
MSTNSRERWATHSGFIFASIGSAVGIGNIWRFPYLVGTNGGGAFLMSYVIVLIAFGLSFMMLEFAVGRYYQSSIIDCLAKIRKRFRWFGVFTVVITTLVTSYYVVILGWILSFLVIISLFPQTTFEEFTNSMWPILAFFAIVAVNYLIIRRGIARGIERLNKIGVVVLVALIIPLTVYGLLLPNSHKGVEYYLTPDFEILGDAKIWSSAFGQIFFSLSIGFGSLVVYGSYLKKEHSLLKSSVAIIAADGLIAITAGFMIFSMLFSFGLNPEKGVPLVFHVMPLAFSEMDYGFLIGALFFSLLLVAGLTSSVGLFQVPVAALEDTLKCTKKRSTLITCCVVAVVGMLPALSYSSFDLRFQETKILDLMDEVFGTYGLSISAVLFSIAVLWFIDKKVLTEQFNIASTVKFPAWSIQVMKYVLPAIVLLTMIVHFGF